MRSVRYRHTATLLPSGKVLLAGGQNATSVNDTAEVYDPTSNNFTATTGNMTAPRDSHTATLLPTGKVLIAGGINGDAVTATAESYDPATGKFTAAEPMKAARVFHTATRLSNGRVLLAGGFDGSYLNSAEIYDPATGTFRLTSGSMISRRDGHTATLLDDGRVLLAGGTDGNGALNSAEFYDPSTDSFSLVAGTMTAARNGHTAALQSETQVLILGGTNATDGALKSAEIFDADTQSFTAVSASMTAARNGHTATLLEPSGEGYVRVDCQEGLVFTEFYGMKRDGAMMNGIDVQKYRDVTRLYSPQFAIMTGFKTLLNLINANPDNDAQVTVTLHAPDGRVLGTPATLQIMHNGKVQDDLHNIFQLDAGVQNTTGWIEISSSNDRVLGTVSFTNEDDVFLTSFELSGAPLTRFRLSARRGGQLVPDGNRAAERRHRRRQRHAGALVARGHRAADRTVVPGSGDPHRAVPERLLPQHGTVRRRQYPGPVGPAGAQHRPHQRPRFPFHSGRPPDRHSVTCPAQEPWGHGEPPRPTRPKNPIHNAPPRR